MSDLASSIEGLLKSEKYSDLILKCQDVSFKVHRAIVCTRSPVLAAAVDGNFKEAISGEIDLPEDEIDVVRAMISYLYTGDYDDIRYDDTRGVKSVDQAGDPVEFDEVPEAMLQETNGWGEPTPEEESAKPLNPEALIFNVKMYLTADKYHISGLKELATRKYGTVVGSCWNTTEFSGSVRLLWENTMESDVLLKNAILTTVADNMPVLLVRQEFEDVLRSHSDLSIQVLRRIFCPPPTKVHKKKGKKGASLYDSLGQ